MRRKKKGSATFIVIMIMTIILILSFSLIPLTLSSVKQSNMLYGRNKTYYTGEGSIDKMLHYIDVFSERARISAYNKCFKSGEPNLDNSYVSYIYKKYMPDENGESEIDYEEFQRRLINYFKYEFNKGIIAFFDSIESKTISVVEGDAKGKENVIYAWNKLQENIGEDTLNNEPMEVNVQSFNDINEGSEFYRFKGKIKDSEKISNLEEEANEIKGIKDNNPSIDGYNGEKILRETFYISSLNNDKTKRYISLTLEFNPLEKDIPIKNEGIEIKNHEALTYGIISEDNLIAQNNLTINSSVIVGGQGEPSKVNNIDSVEYGGIIAGGDKGAFNNIDTSLDAKTTNETKGEITIKNDAFVGEIDGSGNVHGGFIETLGEKSKINIKGNSYSHSLVTHENSKLSNITIDKSAFIGDNVSLNGEENNINIKNHLVGFEDGASNISNHLSSPAIVINKKDSKKNGKLTIGGQVTLGGEGFVESLVTKHDNKDVLFKTFETTAIYPNYIAYSNFLNSGEFKEFYKAYEIKAKGDEKLQPIDMLDKYSVMSNKGSTHEAALVGIDFMLSYFTEYKDELSNYDLGNNSIDAKNINLTGKLNESVVTSSGKIEDVTRDLNSSKGINVSYFNYILYANGKMHLTRQPSDNALLEETKKSIINSKIGEDIVLPTSGYSASDIGGTLNSIVFPAIKTTLTNRLMLRDVVSEEILKENGYYEEFKNKTRLDRCFNWDKINGDIKDTGDAFIWISKDNVKLSSKDVDTFKDKIFVFIASEGDVEIDAGEGAKIKGGVFAKGNIITRGNNIEITANKETASIIANYENDDFKEFLSPGAYVVDKKERIEGITRTVKSNIKVLDRRQILE